MDIITIGEMVIDFIPGTEEGSYIRNPGGAPANVAIAAARNGLSAGIFCKVGDDDFGRFLIQTLEDNQVTPLSPELCREAVTTMAGQCMGGGAPDRGLCIALARRGTELHLCQEAGGGYVPARIGYPG